MKCVGSYGYEIMSASGGKEAIEKAEKECFDLVIADIRMPEMNESKIAKYKIKQNTK